jgi:hypothetical protein
VLEMVRHQTLACHKLYGVSCYCCSVIGAFGGTGNATIVIFSLP